jgi:photosystem II stability/assembly factor-like uncharacterized protein
VPGPRRRLALALAALFVVASTAAPPAAGRATAQAQKAPFTIDAQYQADFQRFYTTQFPSRFTNQPRGSAWRTAHDAAAIQIRDEWARLLRPFQQEGAFAELRPFNFLDPTGLQPDNKDPEDRVGPENNVLAFVPGADPLLRNQVVVIGGHYDCVDVTVDGGLDCGMQIPVTSAVLEGLTRYWLANGIRPRRSVAIFAIDGEEQCLCGSVHYTTAGSPNALLHHLELPPPLSVVAYHDTDMIGANYPNRLFGRSDNDFMPLNVFSAPSVDDPSRALGPFAAYQTAIANPAFLARFKLYRQALLAQRDRFFRDFRAKYPTWTYADGVTKPLFTDAQKKYLNIVDDPLNRSDHTVFIVEGIPGDLNIGLADPSATPPGWVPYHNVGETKEVVEYARSGRMGVNADVLLGYEATAAWIAYMSGAGEDSDPAMPFFIGETTERSAGPIEGVRLGSETAVLPSMPASEVGGPWTALGPADTIVRGLTVHPTDPDRVYLATQERGFLSSTDRGRTFTESNAGLDGFVSLWSVTVDPANAGRLYASTHQGGVYRSDDEGRTWRHTHAAAVPTASDVVYARPLTPVTSAELLKANVAVSQEHAFPGGMWLYGYDQCLARFAPAGQACATRADWPSEGFDPYPMVLQLYRYASDAVVARDGSLVASGFSTVLTGGGTFRSEDGGGTWAYTWTPQTGHSNIWRVAGPGPRLYASGTGGVFRSDDSGRTWTRTAAPTSEVRALAVDPTNADVVYAGSWNAEGGIFKTTDGGGAWTRVSNGLPARAGVAALAVDPTDPLHVAAATYWYGVYLSSDGGQTWKLAADAMPTLARQRLDDVDFAGDGTLYAASHHGVFVLGAQATRHPAARDAAAGGTLPATGGTGAIGAPAAVTAVAGVVTLLVVGSRRRRRRPQ